MHGRLFRQAQGLCPVLRGDKGWRWVWDGKEGLPAPVLVILVLPCFAKQLTQPSGFHLWSLSEWECPPLYIPFSTSAAKWDPQDLQYLQRTPKKAHLEETQPSHCNNQTQEVGTHHSEVGIREERCM